MTVLSYRLGKLHQQSGLPSFFAEDNLLQGMIR